MSRLAVKDETQTSQNAEPKRGRLRKLKSQKTKAITHDSRILNDVVSSPLSRNVKIVDGDISHDHHQNKFEFCKKIKTQFMLEDGLSFKVILTPPTIEYDVDC
jgi:hypothetical protein